MTKLDPKTIGLGAVFLLLIGYAAFSVFSGSDPVAKLAGGGKTNMVAEKAGDSRVPTVNTDPFFHPSVQEVAPNGAPTGAVSPVGPNTTVTPPMSGNLSGGNAPMQVPAPAFSEPYAGAPPSGPGLQPLQGTLPPQMPDQPNGQAASPPNQTVTQPEVPVKVLVQGLVISSSPSAFVRINEGTSLKVTAGTKLEGGIVVLEISEQTVTLSRKGKKYTLRPGQAENL